MNIAYNYEILSVDAEARCMEVRYTADGHDVQHISARLPFVGETLQDIIEMYSPVAYWRERAAVVVIPELLSGTVDHTVVVDPLTQAKATKLAEISSWRFSKEVSGITVDNTSLSTSREAQGQLAAVYTQLASGVTTTIDFKCADGTWAAVTADKARVFLEAVASHVQACFTAEKAYAQQVAAATTVEAVEAVVPV